MLCWCGSHYYGNWCRHTNEMSMWTISPKDGVWISANNALKDKTLREWLTSLPPVIQHWDSKTPLGPFEGLHITAFPGNKQVPQPAQRKIPALRKSVNFRAASCVPKDFLKCEKQECRCALNIYWTHSCSKKTRSTDKRWLDEAQRV